MTPSSKHKVAAFTRILIVSTLAAAAVGTVALAELFGPLGNVMHTLNEDLDCIEKPDDFLCSGVNASDAAAEMLAKAQLLHDNPTWVTALIPSATADAVQAKAELLIGALVDLQSAIAAGDEDKKAQAIAHVHAVETEAHQAFNNHSTPKP